MTINALLVIISIVLLVPHIRWKKLSLLEYVLVLVMFVLAVIKISGGLK